MKRFDVVILTDDKHQSREWTDWYYLQVLLEDELVKTALQAQGLSVTRKSWSDPDFDWSCADALLFRTTWDYFDRYKEFQPWLERVSKVTQLLNPKEIIDWNLHKSYLLDLAQKGVNTVETLLLAQNQDAPLKALMQQHQWQHAIVKPAISGAARHTYKVTPENLPQMQQQLDTLIKDEDFMLQPFQQQITEFGELSLMVMGGKVTHAVRKVAKAGDFRVQDDHGGRVLPHTPASDEIELAEKAIAACNPLPLYARVDMVKDNQGQWAIMELELIEPELFFRFDNSAAHALASAIKLHLHKK